MFWNRAKAAGLVAVSVLAVSVGTGVMLRGEPLSTPGGAQAPQRSDQPGRVTGAGENDHEAVVTLRRRVDELERKVDALLKAGSSEASRKASGPGVDPDSILKVRPRFECLIERVLVKAGATVKKGDPLAEVYSAEVASAKNDFLYKTAQKDHHQRLYDLRERLVKTGAISQQLWVDTQNDREKSKLDLMIAHDRLSVFFGLNEPEIEAIKSESSDRKARYTLRSPVEGTVTRIDARAQDLADPKTVIMEITSAKP
jgi:multidrug efflux pump subunit AcrA (membrane-fusion protein)